MLGRMNDRPATIEPKMHSRKRSGIRLNPISNLEQLNSAIRLFWLERGLEEPPASAAFVFELADDSHLN